MPSTKPDCKHLSDLLRDTARGNRTAFQQLYEATSAVLFGTISRVLHDPELAGDTLCAVYLEIWERAADEAAQTDNPLAWMIALAHRHAVACAREKRVLSEEERSLARRLSTSLGLKEDRLNAEALARISEVERELLLAAYLYATPLEQLAKSYRMPPAKVEAHLRRALRALCD